MTIENRTFISPSDLLGIEYECGYCHSKYFIPLEKFAHVIYQCPNCKVALIGATHIDSTKRSDEGALLNFVEALKDIQTRPITLRFEISGEPSEKK